MAELQHDHVSELLPWYANGTLPAAQRSEVDRHVGACERCRAELAWIARLRADVQAATPQPAGDLGLSRFLERIAPESNVLPLRRRERPRWLMPALALAASVLVAQTLVIGVLLHDRQQTLHTLGGSGVARGALLQVTFAPQATEEQIRTLLASVDARIVDGPGALGVYTLSVAPERADATVRALQAAQDLVASVALSPPR
ncbi:MAG TPA: zf-HC2 domain-containing protein [Burkholderiales bacterium]|nr:zf-HC2 domain-containing protein [Burkholderiales bacterium]